MYLYMSKKMGTVYATLDNHHHIGSSLFEDITESLCLGEDMIKMLYPKAQVSGIASSKIPSKKGLDKKGPLKWVIKTETWERV